MNDRSDFQQLVDRSLSPLQWNERRKQQVLRAMETERRPIRMKKTPRLIAIALALCLMTSAAFAATLVYSPRFDKTARADALLAESYGVTAEMLHFFTRSEHGDIVRYRGIDALCGMKGDYVIDLSTDEAKWLFDGPTAAGWDAAKLSEVLDRCRMPDGYAQVAEEARTAAAAIGLTIPAVTLPDAAELQALLAENTRREEQSQSLARITLQEAESLARAAIQEQYGLTDAQMQLLEFVPESTYYNMVGDVPVVQPYFGLNQSPNGWQEKDGIYVVVVNVQDGAIEEVRYDSALLGNG